MYLISYFTGQSNDLVVETIVDVAAHHAIIGRFFEEFSKGRLKYVGPDKLVGGLGPYDQDDYSVQYVESLADATEILRLHYGYPLSTDKGTILEQRVFKFAENNLGAFIFTEDGQRRQVALHGDKETPCFLNSNTWFPLSYDTFC